MKLIGGQRYTAVRTGKNRGERFFRTFTFIAAYDQEPEPWGHGRTEVDQDRVFVRQATRFPEIPWESVPDLVVTGSIQEVK